MASLKMTIDGITFEGKMDEIDRNEKENTRKDMVTQMIKER